MPSRQSVLFFAFLVAFSALISQLVAGGSPISRAAKSVALKSGESVNVPIPTSDPDFSIVVFPDTQYYNGSYNYVFQDQANWVVANKSALNIKMVIGLGDIVDGGGYPVDSAGKIVGTCRTPPPTAWQKEWQQAQAAIRILTTHGIPYQPTIGNHD